MDIIQAFFETIFKIIVAAITGIAQGFIPMVILIVVLVLISNWIEK